jgi:uncharacterized protein YdcH (DUF465 family)
MEKAIEQLIQKYIQKDAELRDAVCEHKNLEEEIESYNKRIHLTPEEETERKNLQKKKLQKKEQIYSMIGKYGDA